MAKSMDDNVDGKRGNEVRAGWFFSTILATVQLINDPYKVGAWLGPSGGIKKDHLGPTAYLMSDIG